MNEIARVEESGPVDQFARWREALATGKPVAYERGQPTPGYYRVRDRNPDRSIRWDAVGIWFDDETGWTCVRTGLRRAPTHLDEMEELFAGCSSSPISYELFKSIMSGGEWPEMVAEVEVSPDLPPHEAIAAELTAQQDAARKWLADLGRKPASQDEADKAANFATKFGEIEAKAEKTRVAEKEPHLEAGREVDARYTPTREAAKSAKVWARKLSDDYAIAERARRKAETDAENAKRLAEFEAAQALQRAQDAERAADAAKLAAAGIDIPEPPPIAVAAPKLVVAEPVRLGTVGRRQSIKATPTYEITDATALLKYLAERNHKSDGLLAAALADAKALAAVGTEVPGFRVGSTEGVR